MFIVVSQCNESQVFSQLRLFYWKQSHCFGVLREMEEAATETSSRFRPPKSCDEEVSLLSTHYKDTLSGLLIFSEIGKLRTRKKNFRLLETGNVFKDLYDVTCNRVHNFVPRVSQHERPWEGG